MIDSGGPLVCIGVGATEKKRLGIACGAGVRGVQFSRELRDDVLAGEPDRETLRERAAHAGPIDEDTLVYRIEPHALTPAP